MATTLHPSGCICRSCLLDAVEPQEPELHTITWSVKRMRELKAALETSEAAHLETFKSLESAFLFICGNMPFGPTNNRTPAGKLIDSLRVPLATARELLLGEQEDLA